MGRQAFVKFEKKILEFGTLGIDSSCLIYHIEENKNYLPLTEILFEELLPKGQIEAICSSLLLTEVLTRPMIEKRQDLVLAYKALILGFPHLTLVSFDKEIAETAAYFRAEYQLKTPDAIHIATAKITKAEAVIANDNSWKRIKEMNIIILNQFIN